MNTTLRMLRNLIALISAVVIGAMGSGLWDISKPILVDVLSVLGDLFPLLLPVNENRIYEAAAIATSAELRVRSVLPGVVAAGAFFLLLMQRILYVAGKSAEDSNAMRRRPRFATIAANFQLVLVNLMIFTAATVQLYEWSVAARIARAFEQRIRACGPSITSADVLVLNSWYAMMKSRVEFDAIMGSIQCGRAQFGPTSQ